MVLVGMQPVLTQVPPKNFALDDGDLHAGFASRPASDGPAWPAPMMMASNFLVMRPSIQPTKLAGLQRRLQLDRQGGPDPKLQRVEYVKRNRHMFQSQRR